ncbi:antibiotic biosynthesis monooxygenase family protein [Pseudoalteromonas sp. SSDWG2]|uniref:antibiotic biosynthesis monooxygenase family protein n=1 Tax=Pseudoalteromonas sp. SSDWG2 TaxID=3139391 RepID=UPI003BA965F4
MCLFEPKKDTAMQEPVILINPFVVPEGKLEESIKYWESHRDFLKQQPGYVSTKLHQSLANQSFLGEPTYQLINVAIWESQEDFNAAAMKMRSQLGATSIEGLIGDPALYKVIRQ